MKKGFTLLELLAVIVVLAIIALIVTPFVSKAIKNAKKGAFVDSMYNLVTSAELYTAKKMSNEDFSETVLHSINGIEVAGLDFKYKGKSLKDVYLEINEKGKVRLLVWDDGFCAKKDFDEAEVVVTDTEEGDCSLVALDAPVIAGGSEEWAVSRTINVVEDPDNIELDHYQYYLSRNNEGGLIGGHWVDLPNNEEIIKSIIINPALLKEYENSTDENFEVDLKREYYVYFRGVDTLGKNGLVSNGEPVKIDNEEYDITVDATENGTVSVNGGLTKAKVGTSISVTTTASTGYQLNTLKYNNNDIKTSKTFKMPTSDVRITGTYSKIPYQLTWAQATGGTIAVKVNNVTKTSPATVVMGDTVTITTTASTGYQLNTLKYNNNDIKTSKTFKMPTSDVRITGTYSKIPYQLTWAQATGGTIAVKVNNVTKTSPATVVMGDTVTITTTPATNYKLSALTYNGTNILSTKKFTMPNGAVTVKATWVLDVVTKYRTRTYTAAHWGSWYGSNIHCTASSTKQCRGTGSWICSINGLFYPGDCGNYTSECRGTPCSSWEYLDARDWVAEKYGEWTTWTTTPCSPASTTCEIASCKADSPSGLCTTP